MYRHINWKEISPISASIALTLLSSCQPLTLSEWVFAATNSAGAKFYVDVRNAIVKGDLIETWELADFADDGSDWRSMKTLVQYKCKEGTSAQRRSEFFSGSMGTGVKVDAREESAVFKPPVFGMPSAELNKLVCTSVAGR